MPNNWKVRTAIKAITETNYNSKVREKVPYISTSPSLQDTAYLTNILKCNDSFSFLAFWSQPETFSTMSSNFQSRLSLI